MTVETNSTGLWEMLEKTYRREVILLQNRRFDEWLALFSKDLVYRVPTIAVAAQGDTLSYELEELSYYEENYVTLSERVRKVMHPQTWAEQPGSKTRYFIQLLDVLEDEDNNVHAVTNFLLIQNRPGLEQLFCGERHDVLKQRQGSDFEIARREVLLDRPVLGNQGLSIFF